MATPPLPPGFELEPVAPTPLARGQRSAGNIDLANRPVVRNPDGSISTVRSISANFDGNEVLIPTVSDDGRILSDDDAIAEYQRTGRNLGVFDTPDNATAYAESLHNQQADRYAPPPPPPGFVVEGQTLGDSQLRHADGRLTEAGWEAERDSLAASRQKEIEGTSFLDNLIAGYGRSLPNLYQGAKQAYVDSVASLTGGAADVLGDFGGETLGDLRREAAGYFGGMSKELQQETNQERIDSQALTSSGGGMLGGFAGDVVNTIPLAGAGVAARGAGLLKATGQAALGGALQGAIQPVAKEGERLGNTVLGGALGGGLSAIGRGAMTLGESVMPQNVTARALNFFNDRANRSNFAADSEALAQRTGIDLTPGMVSGSKSQTAVENMARQSVFSADTAFQADERIANQAIANVNRVMDRISPDSVSPQAIGDRMQRTVRDAVGEIEASRERTAAEQFGRIRRMVGDAPIVDYANTRNTLQEIVNEYSDVVGADARRVRTQAQRLLDEIGQRDGYTLDAARRARGSYGRAARGGEDIFSNVNRDVNRRIAGRMYAAMSDDLDSAGARLDDIAGFGTDLPVPAGTTATRPSDMLRQANDDYRRHSDLLKAVEMSPLRRLLGDEINVDDFMTVNTLPPETVIARVGSMKPSELGLVRDFMERNAPDTWQQYKRMIVEDALGEAQTAAASAGARVIPFNATGFVRAMGGDKPQKIERLQQIFGQGEMAEVMDAMQAARRMGDKFGANFSGTGPYNELVQASNGFVDAFKNASVRAAVGTAAPIAGFNRIARMMADSDGRRALIELSRLPPGSRRANDLAAYLAAIAGVGDDKPLEIEIVGGTPESRANQ